MKETDLPKTYSEHSILSTNSNEVSGLNLSQKTQEWCEKRQSTVNDLDYSLRLCSEGWAVLREDLLTRGKKPEHPTGLKELDDVIWGLHKKEVLAVSARTSQGKSAFTTFITKNLIEQSKAVIYFSLEMSMEQLLERLFVQVTKINNRDLRRGLCKSEILKNEDTFKTWCDKAKLVIDDMYGFNFDNVENIVSKVRPDFVIIDYVNMISVKGYKSKLDAIDEFTRRFKQLTKQYNFGGILIAQINRQGVDGAELQHMKGAGVLEENPDSVIFLKWDWSVQDPTKYVIDVKKQRHGEVKNGIVVDFIPQHYMFEDRNYGVKK